MKKVSNGSRLYVGNIPGSATKQEIIKIFEEHGKISDIDIKYNRNSNGTNYAFIEYENPKSAEKTILKRNGKKFKGYMLKVEYSIEKKNKEANDFNRSQYRVVVKNLPKVLKWKSIKEFLSKAGKLIYTHAENGITIAEYEDKESMLKAVNTLDRIIYNSKKKMYVRVLKDIPYDESDIDDNIEYNFSPFNKNDNLNKKFNFFSSSTSAKVNNYNDIIDDNSNNNSNNNNATIKKNKQNCGYSTNKNVKYESFKEKN
ncbi:alternative splicing factor ASF-1, putative [Plasmodium relictum]|uniref:Alternative splicing factor ASF-1, putative n=1 Tax=Plasmodium relictum TaxID=85471 RepID=A0A1J1H5M9_PLARL|nr:alternative splicing factor ASF-1, putative [Plasmodium relictum]CRH00066.1 alternative splicing factor ASF-1, putative [Plasmodium relictum]